jgi:N-acetyl-anhydromuramyl-L-alanine amidase AmpD
MPAQIRMNRPDVTDRFPMLGFTIRTDGSPQRAEVSLGTDLTLFRSENKAKRTNANFYSSRAAGPLSVPRGEAIYLVPPQVLARFIGADRLYFALATAPEGNGARFHVEVMPGEGSPYISLKGLTPRSLRRVRLLPSRQQRAAGYGGNGVAGLEWAGDVVAPGMQPAGKSTAPAPADRQTPAAVSPAPAPNPAADDHVYNDGFGPLPAPPSSGSGGTTPAQVSKAQSYYGQATSARPLSQENFAADGYGIEGPIPDTETPDAFSGARALDTPQPEYSGGSRFAPAHPSNYRKATQARTIDRIVIHITDGGSKISGTIAWFQDPKSHVSAHYIVGQDGEVVQMVRNNDIAWHASQANSRSIGIEHIANSGEDKDQKLRRLMPSEAEYQASAALVAWLCAQFGIAIDREHIVGHSEISPRDHHDDCPNSVWDWDHYMDLVSAAAASAGSQAQALAARAWSRAQDAQDDLKDAVTQIAASSDIARYPWRDRGAAPAGYIKGMALVYARVYSKLKAGDAAALEMAKAKTADPSRDALTWYDDIFAAAGMSNDTAGVDTLRHLFVLLIGLGMRESSGKYCEGRDRSATNTTAETAEAGLFQTSFNARTASFLLPTLFAQYSANPSGFLDIFKEGVQCLAKDLENFGSGDGREFQRLSKECPAFAAEFAAVALRNIRTHWGPINRKKAEVRPECDAMLRQIEACVDASSLSEALSARSAKGGHRKPVSGALVVGLEDRQKARKFAHDYRDLFQWSPPASVVSGLNGRGFTVQTLDAAVGDLNLDFYKVLIRRFPEGWDAPRLLQYFIRNINQFVDTDLTEFIPYDDSDVQRLASSNPVGTVFKLDFLGPDNAAIVISDVRPQFYAVTTIHTPWSGDHPVSGHRQFGYIIEDDKTTTFYTRGADRATLGFPGTEHAIFYGGEKLWQSFQHKLAAFINNNGGEAEILEPFSERFDAQAVREEFGHFDAAQSLAAARAMSTGAFTLNWDEVELIAQPSDFSCWAAAAAMVVGWKDRVSLSPETVGKICNRTTASGLDPTQVEQFAREIGLVFEYPQCYTVDGFRTLIGAKGPLWVGAAVPGLHAIVVTGIYQDGTDTFVRIADPWDRQVGTPGAPGAYLTTHTTGSRYIMRWDDFVREYETAAMAYPAVNLQILHSGGTAGHQANYGFPSPPLGYAQSVASRAPRVMAKPVPVNGPVGAKHRRPAAALANESFAVHWNTVPYYPQTSGASCWAASAAMVVGWRDDRVVTDGEIAAKVPVFNAYKTGLFPTDRQALADAWNLIPEPPASYTIDAWRDMLRYDGPLYLDMTWDTSGKGGHARVLVGMESDGAPDGSDTTMYMHDPWPGTPGKIKLSFADFLALYEGRVGNEGGQLQYQILHADGVPAGRQTVIAAPFALTTAEVATPAAERPEGHSRPARLPSPPRARTLEATGIPPAQPARRRVRGGTAEVSWELDQYDEIKTPASMTTAVSPVRKAGPTINLSDWPYIDGRHGRTYAAPAIDWSYGSGGVGDVQVSVPHSMANDGYRLKVTAGIANGPDTATVAAIRVVVRYEFSRAGEPAQIAVTEVTLYGDGRYERRNHDWQQLVEANAA